VGVFLGFFCWFLVCVFVLFWVFLVRFSGCFFACFLDFWGLSLPLVSVSVFLCFWVVGVLIGFDSEFLAFIV
jgi:hypothetical protein